MKTNKAIRSLFAACTLITAVCVASPAMAKNTKARKSPARVSKVAAKTKVRAKRSKLPRKWVWKRYAKNFDSMFRK